MIGPVLGGGLITAIGWRAVFLVNLPVTALIGVLAVRAVREAAGQKTGGLDIPGQVLGLAPLALLAGGVIEGGRNRN